MPQRSQLYLLKRNNTPNHSQKTTLYQTAMHVLANTREHIANLLKYVLETIIICETFAAKQLNKF